MNFHGHNAGLNVLKARIESMHYYVWTRVASFAKFREMQKTILRKIFRENWVRKTAKMFTADFDPFGPKLVLKEAYPWV